MEKAQGVPVAVGKVRVPLLSYYSYFLLSSHAFLRILYSTSNDYAVLCRVTLADQTVYEGQVVGIDQDRDVLSK